jgi:hypothetical protein
MAGRSEGDKSRRCGRGKQQEEEFALVKPAKNVQK